MKKQRRDDLWWWAAVLALGIGLALAFTAGVK